MTLPDAVRRTLNLRKRDKIRYEVRSDGAALSTRTEAGEQSDPVVGKFPAFLARDMEARPSQIRGINVALVRRARWLVKGVKVDLDAPLQRRCVAASWRSVSFLTSLPPIGH